jgi:hypothetical protein
MLNINIIFAKTILTWAKTGRRIMKIKKIVSLLLASAVSVSMLAMPALADSTEPKQ